MVFGLRRRFLLLIKYRECILEGAVPSNRCGCLHKAVWDTGASLGLAPSSFKTGVRNEFPNPVNSF